MLRCVTLALITPQKFAVNCINLKDLQMQEFHTHVQENWQNCAYIADTTKELVNCLEKTHVSLCFSIQRTTLPVFQNPDYYIYIYIKYIIKMTLFISLSA